MNDEFSYSLKKLGAAITRLREAVDCAQSQLERDGVIQRFEFSFELLWKTIKRLAGIQGIEVRTPRESLEEGFRIGWISNESLFMEMLIDRNRAAHVYDQKMADDLFGKIRDQYTPALEEVLARLEASAPAM